MINIILLYSTALITKSPIKYTNKKPQSPNKTTKKHIYLITYIYIYWSTLFWLQSIEEVVGCCTVQPQLKHLSSVISQCTRLAAVYCRQVQEVTYPGGRWIEEHVAAIYLFEEKVRITLLVVLFHGKTEINYMISNQFTSISFAKQKNGRNGGEVMYRKRCLISCLPAHVLNFRIGYVWNGISYRYSSSGDRSSGD